MQCSSHNFRRREMCFICQLPRSQSQPLANSEDGFEFIGTAPCNTLVIRSLDALTQEEEIVQVIEKLCSVQPRQCHIMRDEQTQLSRCYALAEFSCVADAYRVMEAVKEKKFIEISGKAVEITYSKNTFSTVMSTLKCEGSVNAQMHSTKIEMTNQIPSSMSASAAMAVAESAVLRQHQKAKITSALAQTLRGQPAPVQVFPTPTMPFNVNNILVCTYPVPDSSQFIYDETTKYHYDPVTGLLYDPNSKYFYDRMSQQYFFYDNARSLYIPAAQVASGQYQPAQISIEQKAVISAPPLPSAQTTTDPEENALTEEENRKQEQKRKEKEKKDKAARQIAKDMEKWAKRMNSQKEALAQPKGDTSSAMASKTADISFAMFEAEKMSQQQKQGASNVSLVAQYGGDESDEDAPQVAVHVASDSTNQTSVDSDRSLENMVTEEENKMIDWTKLACMLCSRGFKDTATLSKHKGFSALHFENLNKLRSKYGLHPIQPPQKAGAEPSQTPNLMQNHSLESLMQLGAAGAKNHAAATARLGAKEPGKAQYRDRALERRQKYGIPSPPRQNKRPHSPEPPAPAVAVPEIPVPPSQPEPSADVGGRMMAKMGWQLGQGLGRENQGRTDIVEAEFRQTGVGLGVKNSRRNGPPGENYKDNVKRAMFARYNDMM